MAEQFVGINGFDNYEIGNEGSVRNKKTGRILKTWKSNSGYDVCRLMNGVDDKRIYIHHLVGKAFCANPNMRNELDHIDRNKSNNKSSNLRWVTHSENMRNTIRTKKI